ncbi:MAG: hypothetical protein AAF604_01525 [Acidobacteriota bacterium]
MQAQSSSRLFVALLVALAVAGLALIGWGTDSEIPVLTSLGGALLGTSIASLLGVASRYDLTERVTSLLEETQRPSFTSDNAKLKDHRRKLHRYHASKQNGSFIWQYDILDFTSSKDPGRLRTDVTIGHARGANKTYAVEGGFRDRRFVSFQKATIGDEETSVGVYPDLGKSFLDKHVGLVFKETWDGTPMLAPSIISNEPIEPSLPEGIVSAELGLRLDRIWRSGIRNYTGKIEELLK